MGIIAGTMGIKSYSFEMLVVADQGIELCEACFENEVGDAADPELGTPIFASSEMDRNPSCDSCGGVSFVFSPTNECITSWYETLMEYIVQRPTGRGEQYYNYLDGIAEHMWFVTDEEEHHTVASVYKEIRNYEDEEH